MHSLQQAEHKSIGNETCDDPLSPQRLHSLIEKRNVESGRSREFERFLDEVADFINAFSKPVIVADGLAADCPIIGASDFFADLCGYPREEILGQDCEFLLKNVPTHRISRSARKNLRSMIRMSRLIGISCMGGTSCCQENRARNGDLFLSSSAIGIVLLGEYPVVVIVHSLLANPRDKGEAARLAQENQVAIQQIRSLFEQRISIAAKDELLRIAGSRLPRRRELLEVEPFFSEGLSDRVILANDRRTVMRRESGAIPRGCIVIGERPLRRTIHGLFFSIRIEGALSEGWNCSWPLLGMTQMTPTEMTSKQGYPMRAEWCARSACVGGDFYAWVRDNPAHLKRLFGKASSEDLTSFDGPRPRYRNRTGTPWELSEGDVMSMLYTEDGIIHLMINHQTVLSIYTGKPLPGGDHFALLDCQGQAYEVTRLAHDTPWAATCSQVLGMERHPRTGLDSRVFGVIARRAAMRAVASSSSTLTVTISDPSQPYMRLVAVSHGFEHGENVLEQTDPTACDCGKQRVQICESCRTGEVCHCMLESGRNASDKSSCFLSLRGLSVAADIETREHIWYLVGIQSDMSKIEAADQEDVARVTQLLHERELKQVAERFFKELKELNDEILLNPLDDGKDWYSTSSLASGASTASTLDLECSTAVMEPDGADVPEDLEGESGSFSSECRYPSPDLTRSEGSREDMFTRDGTIDFSAIPGIQAGPKPKVLPSVVLLPDATWR
jgi:hypothetical protein